MKLASAANSMPVPGVLRALAFALLCAGTGLAWGNDPGAALRAKHIALQNQLASNQFGRPLYIESSEGNGELAGDVYALVDSRFEAAGIALGAPANWCDILILHINTKACRISAANPAANQGVVLSMWIGRNRQQPLADASRVDFAYRVGASSANYLRVSLDAGTGPMSTRDYRITLEAVPAAEGKTFIHLGYSYGYGSVGRLAMQTYLATLGRSKVGFTVVGTQPDGQARHIGGMRGIVERNAMRYYAAIEAFLGAGSGPAQARFEKRIRDWYETTELYPRQLREVGREEYLEMKRIEYQRQQAGPA